MPGIYDQLNTAITFGSIPQFDFPRSEETVTVNALQSGAPVDASSGVAGSQFSGFWQDIGKTLVGYAIAKDAQKNSVQTPQVVYVQQQAKAANGGQPPGGGGMLLLILGGLAFLALK